MGQTAFAVDLDNYFQIKSRSNVSMQSIMIPHVFLSIDHKAGRLLIFAVASTSTAFLHIGTVNHDSLMMHPWNEAVNLDIIQC